MMEIHETVETEYKLMNVWESDSIPPNVSFTERKQRLARQSTLSKTSKFQSSVCCHITPMPWYEEVIVMFMWLSLFSLVLFGPIITIILVCIKPIIAGGILVFASLLSQIKVPFVPSSCNHYLATLNLKYFSYRAIWKTSQPAGCYIGKTDY